MNFCYTLSKDSMMHIWEWKSDFISDEYKNNQQFASFKAGKK